ncbi:MAG: chromosome partitioning protein ParB [Elusimicrobia bacterium CG08_land_8_20_14_0_20_51_18]|nr:MAG: chromosome partitioning protein ParB [Elusimicrobia bacterium CG08_land_8_20_14_0_20_51_18]
MRKALGKGIDALITRVHENNITSEAVEKVQLDKIIPNRLQPRQIFDDKSLNELAQSIKTHGLTQPIILSRIDSGSYEIIAGERRFRACKILGLKEIEAIVKKSVDDEKKLAMALVENLQREDLNPVDQALAYKKLMSDYKMNQTEISEYCGKSKFAVSNTLRLLELEENILDSVQNGLIKEGHARALLAIPDKDERNRLYERILSEKLTVRDIENYSKKFNINRKPRKTVKSAQKSPEIMDAQREMEKHLGTKVEIYQGESLQTGKIIIHYYSLDDFDKITGKLKH